MGNYFLSQESQVVGLGWIETPRGKKLRAGGVFIWHGSENVSFCISDWKTLGGKGVSRASLTC